MNVNAPRLEALPAQGNYTLIIFLKTSIRIGMPWRHNVCLKKGYYAYTGSALGKTATGLRKRVARHLAKKKNRHWHIDYLLAKRGSSVEAVVAAASNVNRECEIVSLLQHLEGATVPIAGFGASDCKGKCASHLTYFRDNVTTQAIANVYWSLFGDAQTLEALSLGNPDGAARKCNVTIETATTDNIEELLRIENQCFGAEAYSKEHILDLLKSRNAFALMARVNGEAAGFIIGLTNHDGNVKTGHIVTIDVAAAYRKRGLGLTLLKEAETILKKRGAKTVYLEARADNQAALKLYRKQGYMKTESLKHYYSAGIHGLRLVKRL